MRKNLTKENENKAGCNMHGHVPITFHANESLEGRDNNNGLLSFCS